MLIKHLRMKRQDIPPQQCRGNVLIMFYCVLGPILVRQDNNTIKLTRITQAYILRDFVAHFPLTTRSPPLGVGRAKRCTTELENLCMQSVCFYGDLASKCGLTIRLFAGWIRVFTLLCSTQFHFAADRKQLTILRLTYL